MQCKNNINIIKKELLKLIIKFFMNGDLDSKFDNFFLEELKFNLEKKENLNFKLSDKDVLVLKHKLLSILGLDINKNLDKPLKEYLNDALSRQEITNNFLDVLDISCASCEESKYFVTSSCMGCTAKPCEKNCPFGAISIINEKSVIDEKKCIKCGMCEKVCPYHAIIYKPRPCEEVCPVNAIYRDEKTKTQKIQQDKCISCGKCMNACPFGAILEKSEIIDVLKLLKDKNKKLVAMLAPSILGQFSCETEKIASAVKSLGFYKVEEVAYGADLTTENEAKEFLEKLEEKDCFMTSSCCPAYVEIAKKHIPEILEAVSKTPTPMNFISKVVKEEDSSLITVFIGPCLAKKVEALRDKNTDYVLTFEELDAFFSAMNLDLKNMPNYEFTRPVNKGGRGYGTSCGVTSAILKDMRKDIKFDNKFINGIDKKSIKLLKMYATKKIKCNFLEVMACSGGCVGGPCAVGKVEKAVEILKKEIEKA